MAAALHFKGDALISGLAAAQLWDLLDATQRLSQDQAVDVLLVGRNAEPSKGVAIRRTSAVTRQDIRWRNGIPVTSPARTLLDLAATMDAMELEAAMSVALRRKLVRRSQLDDVIARNPRTKGIAKLRALLNQAQPFHDTRSIYERRLLELLEQAELPRPITNTWVGREFVDALWPEVKLVLEFDSWKYHGGRSNFETDRLRDQRLTVGGHHVMRVTARQIDHTPYALIARVATTIANLRRSPADIPY